jgi:hypothetical protein
MRTIDYDYDNQAWIINGKYIRCEHPATMQCRCFGLTHAGLVPSASVLAEIEATHQRESF